MKLRVNNGFSRNAMLTFSTTQKLLISKCYGSIDWGNAFFLEVIQFYILRSISEELGLFVVGNCYSVSI